MVPLMFAVGAESRGVPCTDLGFLILGEFSLEVLEVVCFFFTMATRLSLLLVSVVLCNTSWFNTYFSLVVSAARLLKYPSRVLTSPLAPSCRVSSGSWSSGRAA